MRLSVLGRKLPFAGRVWQIESAGHADALVVVFTTWDDSRDRLANAVVIGAHFIPIDSRSLAESGLCELTYYPRLAAQMFRDRVINALRYLHVEHRALGGNKLFTAGLPVDLRSP